MTNSKNSQPCYFEAANCTGWIRQEPESPEYETLRPANQIKTVKRKRSDDHSQIGQPLKRSMRNK